MTRNIVRDDGSDGPRRQDKLPPTAEQIRGTRLLNDFVRDNVVSLLSALQMKVTRARLARDRERASRLAHEILSEVMIIALKRADVFDPARRPYSWLMKIGDNVIMQRQAKERTLKAHEISQADLTAQHQGIRDQDATDLFDKLTALVHARSSIDMEENVTAQLEFERLLSLVPEKYGPVLRLAILNDLDSKRLAKQLKTTEGNARQRLFRALTCLRQVLDRG